MGIGNGKKQPCQGRKVTQAKQEKMETWWRKPEGLASSLEAFSGLGEEGNKSDFEGCEGLGQGRGLVEGSLQQLGIKLQKYREVQEYERELPSIHACFMSGGHQGAEKASLSACIYSHACGYVDGGRLGGRKSRLKVCYGVAEGARAGEPAWPWVGVCQCCYCASLMPQPELAWS